MGYENDRILSKNSVKQESLNDLQFDSANNRSGRGKIFCVVSMYRYH